MRQISVFHKGVTSDLDYSKYDNNNLVFPTTNIQIVNNDGQGFIVTPIKGNTEVFQLSTGFIPIGGAEYNGIAYIISFNVNINRGEIGSFPSPLPDGGFERTYKPLQNLQLRNGNVSSLQSSIFNFDLENPICYNCFALSDYDDTINLVFTDGKNVLRFVNSGFNQQGFYQSKRFYHEDTLESAIQLIKPVPLDQRITLAGVNNNGALYHGNYFFFYRYKDASNNSTVYMGESEPVSIYDETVVDKKIKKGGYEKTTKSVSLKINNIDISYNFIEIAFVHFFSGADGVLLHRIYRVSTLYNIARQSSIFIRITGFETMIPETISSLLEPVNREKICRSITVGEKMIWGANWKQEPIEYDVLKEVALTVRLGCNDSTEIQRERFHDFYADHENVKLAGYFRGEAYLCKIAFRLKDGFETEGFAVTGIDARNIKPDMVLNSYNSVHTNTDGIIIMPDHKNSPITKESWDLEKRKVTARILNLVFDLSGLKEWLNIPSKQQKWFLENVAEIIFLRAERIPNLMYQGIATRVFGRKVDRHPGIKYNGSSIPLLITKSSSGHQSLVMPQSNRIANNNTNNEPPLSIAFVNGFSLNWIPDIDGFKEYQSLEEETIRACFSCDYIFGDKSKISNNEKPFIQPIYFVNDVQLTNNEWPAELGTIIPNVRKRLFDAYVSFGNHSHLKAEKVTRFSNVFDPNNWIYPDNNAPLGLVNRSQDAARQSGIINHDNYSRCLYYIYDSTPGYVNRCNRNIQVPAYFGFQVSQTIDSNSVYNDNTVLINTYKFDPESNIYYDLYNDSINLLYYKIYNNNILIKDIVNSINLQVQCFQGDAFLQSTFIKTRTWFPTQETGTHKNRRQREVIGASVSHFGYPDHENNKISNPVVYAHGELTEILTENAINCALRIETPDENIFYPLSEKKQIVFEGQPINLNEDSFALYPYSTEAKGWNHELGTGIESFLINNGNSRTLSIKPYLSFNPNIPKGNNVFKNRIRYSGQQEINRSVLSYRMWNYASKQDFDQLDGEIVKIAIVFGRLVSVQKYSITEHFINREQVIPTNEGELVIGVRTILSAQTRVLSNHGSQHNSSIVLTPFGLYGWDWINNTIWKISAQGTQLETHLLDKQGGIESYLKEFKKKVQTDLQATGLAQLDELKNIPFVINRPIGIISGYDIANKEILFNVRWVNANNNEFNEVLRFSERMNQFIGTSNYNPLWFFNIHDNMYSFGKDNSSIAYLHNNGIPCMFYEKLHPVHFSFIVNGYSNDNFSLFDKHFKAVEIESPNSPVPFEKVQFETMFQKAENNPFYNQKEFWLLPEYLMSKWAFPINVANEAYEHFYRNSNLMGKWMKMTIHLNPGINTFVKNIITIFTIKQT